MHRRARPDGRAKAPEIRNALLPTTVFGVPREQLQLPFAQLRITRLKSAFEACLPRPLAGRYNRQANHANQFSWNPPAGDDAVSGE